MLKECLVGVTILHECGLVDTEVGTTKKPCLSKNNHLNLVEEASNDAKLSHLSEHLSERD